MTENDKAAGAASPSVTEVLKRAREKIRMTWSPGWPEAEKYCAVTAIDGNTYGAGLEGYRLMLSVTGAKHGQLSYWNDAPERTKEEVLAAFDKAIALSEWNATPKAEP